MIKIASKNLKHSIDVMSERTDGLAMRLDSLSPKDTMRRGYAIVQTPDKALVISDHKNVARGDQITLTLHNGEVDAEVTGIRSNSNYNSDPTKRAS